MGIPAYGAFIEPILRFLAARPDGAPAREAHDAAAAALQLTEADRIELLPSGVQPVYKNRAGWAHDRLKRAGLSSSPRRGFWQLTPEGMAFARQNASPLSPETVTHLSFDFRDGSARGTSHPPDTASPDATLPLRAATALPESSPDELLELAMAAIRTTVADELLEMLRRNSPKFFEVVVLDLLHKMGYGASRADLRRVGGSGDEGIDGVIDLDKLGLDKVYVQAKRWQQAVGRPEIQSFYGALAGQKAKRGVFITTSDYSTHALQYAQSVEGIVLINGRRLASLMVDHEVGVSAHTLRVPKLDSDYFEEGTE